MATVLLARHGETAWNRDGRVQGWAPSRLTDRGRDQAAALAAHLAAEYAVDRAVASDLRRARETAEYAVRECGLEISHDPAWRERDFGCMQGLTKERLFGDHPEYALSESGRRAAEARPDSGESLLDTRERVLGRWNDLCSALAPDETVLVVAHGGPIRLVLGDLHDLDVVSSVLDVEQDNCALNEIRVERPDPPGDVSGDDPPGDVSGDDPPDDNRPKADAVARRVVDQNVTSFLPEGARTRSDNIA